MQISGLVSRFRFIAPVAAMLVALAALAPQANAQDAEQVKLTDALMKSYIAVQKDLKPLQARLEAAGDKEDPKLEGELEAIAKKAGFKSYTEIEDVSHSLSVVLDGYNADSKTYGDPKAQIEKDLAEVKADKSMKADEKKQLVADLEEAVKAAQPIKFKENIEMVKKYREQLAKAGN